MKEHGPIQYKHFTVVYVPVYQVGDTFQYSLADGTPDEQFAWSLGPVYVLKLEGEFNATTRPFRK